MKRVKIIKKISEVRVGNVLRVYYYDSGGEIRELIGVVIGIKNREKLTSFIFRCQIFGIKFDRQMFVYSPSFYGWERIGIRGWYKKSKLFHCVK